MVNSKPGLREGSVLWSHDKKIFIYGGVGNGL